MPIIGTTLCGKPWRVVCSDRKHPDGKNYLILVDKGNEEIAVAVNSLLGETFFIFIFYD